MGLTPGEVAAAGNVAIELSFRNRSSTSCLLAGYPRVVLGAPTLPSVTATPGGMFDQHIPPANQDPGVAASVALETTDGCAAEPTGARYHDASVTLPDHEVVSVNLGSVGFNAACGLQVTEFVVPGEPIPVATSRPVATLTLTVTAPASVKIGTELIYLVTLSNRGSDVINLVPCPSFLQYTNLPTTLPEDGHELNCEAAHAIAPQSSEEFVMEMSVARSNPGEETVCWRLIAGPVAPCVMVSVVAG